MWTISLPLAVAVSKSSDFILNLNRYRNEHFRVLDKAKKEFESVVGPLLSGVPRLRIVTLEYVYYHGKGIVPDTNNVLAVQDKFFQDTLVNNGILPDDSPEYIKQTLFRYGGIDKANPRVDVVIRDVERMNKMKLSSRIVCTPEDVQEAVKALVMAKFPQFGSLEGATFIKGDDGSMEVQFDAEMVSGVKTPLTGSVTKPAGKAPVKPDGATAMAQLRALPNPSPTLVSLPVKAPDATKGPEGSPSPVMVGEASEDQGSLFSGGALPPPNSGVEAKPASTVTSGKASSATPEAPPPGEPGIFDAFEALNNQS
jgi:hypothetical protein